MTMMVHINESIKEAMRSRDQLRLTTLRMLKAKILAVDARGNLPDNEVIKIFKAYYGNLQELLEQAQNAKRMDVVEPLKLELQIIQEFLPEAPNLAETQKIVAQAIEESGAKSQKELGIVMKAIMKINKDVDGKMAKEIASEMLSG